MVKVLLLTQDLALESMLKVAFMINGIDLTPVQNSGAVMDTLKTTTYDILLMDDEFQEVSRSIRARGLNIPIINMAKDISDPFDFPQLKGKVNAMIKAKDSFSERVILTGEMKIDLSTQLVHFKDSIINLGKMEFAILVSLARKTGEVVSVDKMRKDLEAQGLYFNRAIFHSISELKRVMGKLNGFHIKLKPGEGYKLHLS